MKFTRDFIKEQIELAVSQHPGKRAISVTLQTADPRRVFIISYDAVSGQIMGVLERVGRKPGWQQLIISDKKGKYKLNLPPKSSGALAAHV